MGLKVAVPNLEMVRTSGKGGNNWTGIAKQILATSLFNFAFLVFIEDHSSTLNQTE